MAEVGFDGFGRSIPEPGLFQFHDLIGPVADVEAVVGKSLAAVQLAVVAGDKLADVRGPEGFGSLAAGDLDPGGRVHQIFPILDGPLEPDRGVFVIESRGVVDRLEGRSHAGRYTLVRLELPGKCFREGGGRLGAGFPGISFFVDSGRFRADALDYEFRIRRFRARVCYGHCGPYQEIFPLGRPGECLSPVLYAGQRRGPELEVVANRAVIVPSRNYGNPTFQSGFGLSAGEGRLVPSKAEPQHALVRQKHFVSRRDSGAIVVVPQPDDVPRVAEVFKRLLLSGGGIVHEERNQNERTEHGRDYRSLHNGLSLEGRVVGRQGRGMGVTDYTRATLAGNQR